VDTKVNYLRRVLLIMASKRQQKKDVKHVLVNRHEWARGEELYFPSRISKQTMGQVKAELKDQRKNPAYGRWLRW
jgi:hypothetical protein